MSLSRQVKTALDETRLLMLGAQVLFGFKLNGVFQEEFANLSLASHYVDCAGQVLIATAIGLLSAPSMQHRIVENARTPFASIASPGCSPAWHCCRLPSAWGWALHRF
jgi:hypothetical protein